jgi:hypothetical protein
MANQGRHLYFIKMAGSRPVKIGRGTRPEIRLATLQVGSPYKLKLPGVLEDCGGYEKDFHWYLRKHKMLGEWFAWSRQTEEIVKLALSGGDWPAIVAVRPVREVTDDDWRIGSPLYQGNPKYPQYQARQ